MGFLYEKPVAPKQEDLTTINKRINNLLTTPVNDQSSSTTTTNTTTQNSFNIYSPTNEHNKQSSTALSGINSSFVLHKSIFSLLSPITVNSKESIKPANVSQNDILHLVKEIEIVKDSIDELMNENYKFKADILKEFKLTQLSVNLSLLKFNFFLSK